MNPAIPLIAPVARHFLGPAMPRPLAAARFLAVLALASGAVLAQPLPSAVAPVGPVDAVALPPAAGGLALGSATGVQSATALTRPRAGPSYRIAAGDLVRVSVFQNPELTVEARVNDDGTLSYPLLGALALAGLSAPQAEQRIAEGLRQGEFVRQPQVSVAVLQTRGHMASVLGQVNRPGRYALEVPDLRLSDLLALAGGAAPGAADTVVVTGERDGRRFRQEIDLPGLFGPEAERTNLDIRHGDTVWLDRQPLVYIYGEVQRPGVMRLERGMTLMQALAAGGGLTPRGTERGIRVHRRDTQGRVQSLRPTLDEPVRDGDVVFVRESLF